MFGGLLKKGALPDLHGLPAKPPGCDTPPTQYQPEQPATARTGRAIGQPRIAIVLPGLGAGGSERVVSTIANAWAERGWRVMIVTFEAPDTPSYYLYDARVTINRLGLPAVHQERLQAWRATVHRVSALRRALRAASPDLVISFLTRTNVLTLLATRKLGIPVVVSERNNPEIQTVGRLWGWLRQRLYPRSFGLVTMTQGVMDFFTSRMEVRGWVIPNPANLPQGWHGRRVGGELAAVGRLVPQKGFDLLLTAFAEIAGRFPEWTLVIWGEGPERANLEGQCDRLDLADRVRLPGVSAQPGIWIETADAFVLSSRHEGWGIVLLEAMAAGLPVVSFDCQWGPREMIEDGIDGLLVPPEDCPALAESLATVLADAGLRARLGAAARSSTERFAPGQVVAAWDKVIYAAIAPS